jgi:hypothetical protein
MIVQRILFYAYDSMNNMNLKNVLVRMTIYLIEVQVIILSKLILYFLADVLIKFCFA